MASGDHPYAGLILPLSADLDPAPYLEAVAEVLARLDAASGAPVRRSRKRPALMADRYGIALAFEDRPQQGATLVLRLIARDGAPLDEELASRLLSDVVLATVRLGPAEQIEWFSPETLISPEEFIRLRSYVSPRRRAFARPEPEGLPQPDRIPGTGIAPPREPVEIPSILTEDATPPARRRLALPQILRALGRMRVMPLRLLSRVLSVVALGLVAHQTHLLSGLIGSVLH
ncbi:MAG TPA: hypothetical protein DD444_23580 [Citreicella sp.]|jgi:hypothetical protein|nr:hypothetical protein [Citreicella sp.]HBT00797.1 hypothetical protein [Citreicella sp.]